MRAWRKNKDTKVSVSKTNKRQPDNYIKIIYFDNISITDYIAVESGGKITRKITDIGKTETELGISSGLAGQAGGKTKIIGGLLAKADLAAKVRRSSSRQKNTLLENTTLTDYLGLVKNDVKIKVFTGYSLSPYDKSMTHLKMIAPYVSIIDGKIPIEGTGDMHLDLKSFDKSLSGVKGYFEMLAKTDENTIILRFNSEAFYNNYSLSDITKMDLTFHAIKVGKIKAIDLSLTEELSKITGTQEGRAMPNSGFMSSGSGDNQKEEALKNDQTVYLKVYDVVFAGIESK